MSSFFYHENIETDGDLILGETTITTAEIAVLDGVTAGTAADNKALVLGGSSNITGLGTVGCGAITSSGNLAVTGTITGDTSLTLDSTTITTAEIAVLDGVTAGTAAAGKALVLDSSSNISDLGDVSCGSITASTLIIGAGEVSASAEELNYLSGVTEGTGSANKALVLDTNKDIETIRNIAIEGTFSGGDGNYTFDTEGNVDGLGTVSCGLITTSGTPTENDHVATKQYVDDVASGLDVKKSVRAATTGSGTFASAFAHNQVIDGVTLATNDRILIKNQTDPKKNGIYIVQSNGAPERATDFDEDAEVTAGAFTFVEEGGQEDTGWVLTTNGTITVGSTNLAFSQFSNSTNIIAGTGLTKTGNTLSVNAEQTQITSVGTIATGVWNGTAIAVANGGTGATSLTDLITLGDHTTGNYVASLTAGSLIDLQNNSGEGATHTIDVDLSEAAEAAIANGDYILFLDGGASGTPAKENIADVATLFAGTGLTASSSVISVDAAQTGITSIMATDLKIGEDNETKIDFETADEIHFYANNQQQVNITDGAIIPQTTNDISLGSSSNKFKDAYFDGTVTSDALTLGIQPITIASDVTSTTSGSPDSVTISKSNIVIKGSTSGNNYYAQFANPTVGTIINIFYCSSSSDGSISFDFGTSKLYNGSGLSQSLKFDSPGQAATLVYIGDQSGNSTSNIWAIINTGAVVS